MRVSLMFTALTSGGLEVVELPGYDALEPLGREVVERRALLESSPPEQPAAASPVIDEDGERGDQAQAHPGTVSTPVAPFVGRVR